MIILDEFKKIYEQVKKMKSEIICVSGDMSYGADINFIMMKNMPVNNPLNIFIACKLSSLKAVVEGTASVNILTIPYYLNLFSDKQNLINMIKYNPPTVYKENIRLDESFYEFENYKATTGIFMYRFNNYTVSLYKGLLSLAKKDITELFIYDINDYSFLAQFRVWKNKSLYIDHYTIYMKLS